MLSGWTGVEATAMWIRNADIPSALCCPICLYLCPSHYHLEQAVLKPH